MSRASAFSKQLLGWRYMRYVLVSVVALVADLTSFALLLHKGMGGAAAAATGYSIGIIIHWWLSSRAVFGAALAPTGTARLRQQCLFVVSALVGLGLTTGIVALALAVGLPAIAAKGCAVVVSFNAVYIVRRSMVFAA